MRRHARQPTPVSPRPATAPTTDAATAGDAPGHADGNPLPAGRYLSLTPRILPDAGGQTRAILLRNRIFTTAGSQAAVLTVSATAEHGARGELLTERGLLLPGTGWLNLFEHYRGTDWADAGYDLAPPEELPPAPGRLVDEEPHEDGTPWRRRYLRDDDTSTWEYLRPDGSVFVRVPPFSFDDPATWTRRVQLVSREGALVGTLPGRAAWIRRWLQELTAEPAGGPTFVMLDSRFMVPVMAPLDVPDAHLVYLMHNIHVSDDRRWDRPLGLPYERVLASADHLDAFVTLTSRQGEDIARVRGRAANTYVVPNPVDIPEQPDGVSRDPGQVTVVARLTKQKRLRDAVVAADRAHQSSPDLRLDIFGRGSTEHTLREIVERRGIEDVVTFRGHDPRAREQLWRSSAFLLTSRFEGYPLATLEAMSHGCPVVAYDVKYGPREQITHGVDGFLVEPGDIPGLARHLVQLTTDPELVARMSTAARAKAERHGVAAFLADWARVFEGVLADAPGRVGVTGCEVEVQRLRVGRGRRGTRPGRRAPDERLELRASVRLTTTDGPADPDETTVTLVAVHAGSGRFAELPVTTRRRGDRLQLRAATALAEVVDGADEEGDAVRLVVFVAYRNAVRRVVLPREEPRSGGVEVGYDDNGWRLDVRPAPAPAGRARRTAGRVRDRLRRALPRG